MLCYGWCCWACIRLYHQSGYTDIIYIGPVTSLLCWQPNVQHFLDTEKIRRSCTLGHWSKRLKCTSGWHSLCRECLKPLTEQKIIGQLINIIIYFLLQQRIIFSGFIMLGLTTMDRGQTRMCSSPHLWFSTFTTALQGKVRLKEIWMTATMSTQW